MEPRGRAFRELAKRFGPALHEIADAAAINDRFARSRHQTYAAHHANHDGSLPEKEESKALYIYNV